MRASLRGCRDMKAEESDPPLNGDQRVFKNMLQYKGRWYQRRWPVRTFLVPRKRIAVLETQLIPLTAISCHLYLSNFQNTILKPAIDSQKVPILIQMTPVERLLCARHWAIYSLSGPPPPHIPEVKPFVQIHIISK